MLAHLVRSLFVLLENSNGEKGVLLMNKSAFSEKAEDIIAIVKSAQLKEIMKNDIYGNYDIALPSDLNLVKSQLIYPANDKVIAKYRQEEKFWVYNVLSKNKEADRVIYEDPDPHNGFILAPDIKWDGVSMENLYTRCFISNHSPICSIFSLKYDAPASTTLSAVLLDD
ncbi:unnamed protein product, partial [Strongylus vulgaris]